MGQKRLATAWAPFAFIMAFLLLRAVGAPAQRLLQGLDSSGKAAQTPAAFPAGARPLRIAVVQTQSSDRDIDENLERASTFADAAAAKAIAISESRPDTPK
jgi:hypothetical protein